MDHRRSLVALVLCCYAGLAAAGFAQLAPPSGWTAGTATAPATYGAAANEAWVQQTVRTTASLNVGGQSIKVPATMRMAANAPKFLAGRIGAGLAVGLGSPLAIGLTVAAALLLPTISEWIANTDFRWNAQAQQWEKSSANQACTAYFGGKTASGSNCEGAGLAAAKLVLGENADIEAICAIPPNSYCSIYKTGTTQSYGPFDAVVRTGGGPAKPADYETEVRPALETYPLPMRLPNELPGINPFGWPVAEPVLNPNPEGLPQPLFVPQGLPQPVPNTDPQQYRQPGVRVVPAPTKAEPWRVDLQPVDKTGTDPNGVQEPTTEPSTDSNTKPSEKDSDLCLKNPDILACQKLEEVEDKDLDTKDKPISITPDGGWGADNASCPAAKHLTVQGRDIPIPYDLFCTYMQGLRPIIIAMAWLSAGFILLGARESNG